MSLKRIFLPALVAAALVWSPQDASAQSRGTDRATAAPAAAGVGSAGPEQASNGLTNRRSDLPPGMHRRPDGGEPLPPGIQRRFPQPEPEPAPAPAPEPAPEPTCDTTIAMVDGQFVLVDCNGNIVDGSGTE